MLVTLPLLYLKLDCLCISFLIILLTLVIYTSNLSNRLTLIPTGFVTPVLMHVDLKICHSTVGSAQNVTTTSSHRTRRSYGAHSRELVY